MIRNRAFVVFVIIALSSVVWILRDFRGNSLSNGAVRREKQSKRQNQLIQTQPYRILCTSIPTLMVFGSFQIRCRDFKRYTEQWYPNITVGAVKLEEASGNYDASIGCKWPIPLQNSSFGRLYVDIIDQKQLQDEAYVPKSHGVFVQNRFQAEMFPNRTTYLVPHWFNSFPADTEAEPYLPVPQIRELSAEEPLRVATIWTKTKLELDYCDTVRPQFATNYTCLSQKFGIERWYTSVDPTVNETFVNEILQDPQLGPGYLYQHLFRQYDALVVYPKGGFKLKANSLQRIVSQMRSGVPVLVQCLGEAHNDFCQTSQYSCTFRSVEELSALLDRLRDVSLRRKCQSEGLAIAQEYSPRKIVPIYLQALGLNVPSYQEGYW